MNKKAFIAAIVTSVFLISLVAGVQFVNANSKTFTVPDDYSTIQDAINNASENDIVYVKEGLYHESLVINKSLSLIGENRETTIIDGAKADVVITITCDFVTVKGFTIRNSSTAVGGTAGIILRGANYCDIASNKIAVCSFGIKLTYSSNNYVAENSIDANQYSAIKIDGSYQTHSNNNILYKNAVAGNGCGIEVSLGENNSVIGNIVENNQWSINVYIANNNSFVGNNVTRYGEKGITFTSSINNTFYHNNFYNMAIIDNGWAVPPWTANSSLNLWDNGKEGNYWSNYNVSDANGDGIADTPYTLYANNIDRYPLLAPINISNIILELPSSSPSQNPSPTPAPSLIELPYAAGNFSPTPNSTNVPLNTTISISFGRPPSICELNITPNVPIKERIFESEGFGGTYIFHLSEQLQPQTTYTVTITFGQETASEGFAPTSTRTWAFTTGNPTPTPSAPDGIQPELWFYATVGIVIVAAVFVIGLWKLGRNRSLRSKITVS